MRLFCLVMPEFLVLHVMLTNDLRRSLVGWVRIPYSTVSAFETEIGALVEIARKGCFICAYGACSLKGVTLR